MQKYLYIIYTQIFIQYLYTLYTKIFIHYLYTNFYMLFIHYLYIIYTKNIYTNIFIQIYLYLNRSSSQILKNFARFLPQLIRRHNELPSFITNRYPIFLCVEGLVIHCTFLHWCVSAQFPMRILVKWVHYRPICIKEQFSDVIEVQLRRFCKLKKTFVIYLSLILKIELHLVVKIF